MRKIFQNWPRRDILIVVSVVERLNRRWAQIKVWLQSISRPWQLLATVAATLVIGVLIDRLTGWHVYHRLFYPDQKSPADVQAWSALIYALVLIGGLPVAFLIWHWRDVNVRDQIATSRKDTNLKEFQEVCLRAAGALDEKVPAEAREQLQIAALHQLRGFLQGKYGEDFKRPAFELLLSGHAAAIRRIGVPELQAQIEDALYTDDPNTITYEVYQLREKLTPIDRERMLIIRDEAQYIFTPAYPLDYRRFDLLHLSYKMLPKGLDLTGSSFFGSTLTLAHLKGVLLMAAKLEGANLMGAHLEDADLRYAIFDDETKLASAKFNNATKFDTFEHAKFWEDYSEAENETIRAPWIARGMVNVDAPPAAG